MSIEQKCKELFRKKSSDEFYDLMNKFKTFIDLSLQESLIGTPEERIRSYNNTFIRLRDALIYEINILNYNKKLIENIEDEK